MAAAWSEASRSLGPEADRSTVLVVNADPATRDALGEALSARFRVELASDVEAGWATAQSSPPDAAIIELSELDGFAFHSRLLASAATADIPVVFWNAPSDELVAQCLEAGADHLAPPLKPRELVARIDRLLRDAATRRSALSLAQTDALTGLPNYRALTERAEHEFERALRYEYPLSAVTLDLDHLKQINDRFGHAAGNRAITAFARHLANNLRDADFAARFGGDEFVVLLPHQTPSETAVFVERIRKGTESLRLRLGGGVELQLTLSAGIAGHWKAAPKTSPEHLLQSSDAALYEAKRLGRNQFSFHEVDLPELAPVESLFASNGR